MHKPAKTKPSQNPFVSYWRSNGFKISSIKRSWNLVKIAVHSCFQQLLYLTDKVDCLKQREVIKGALALETCLNPR